MSIKRLAARVPSADAVGVAKLTEHTLKFHKIGKDGSAKCDAEYTGNPEDRVLGVVFRILASEKPRLDRIEGLGYGYGQTRVMIAPERGEKIPALTYRAIPVDASLKPFRWYKEHVLIGARENHLPARYIEAIEAIESIDDPDPRRHATEMAIYKASSG